MKVLILTLILSIQIFIHCQDCGTPVECYAKAIEILKTDREEMRIVSAKQQEIINNLSKQVKDLQDQLANKGCYIATNKSGWGQCPYGGEYRGGWANGTSAGIREQNKWTDGDSFLCCK